MKAFIGHKGQKGTVVNFTKV